MTTQPNPAHSSTTSSAGYPAVRYLRPNWFARRVMNPLVVLAARAGLSLWGTRLLRVRGRHSGEMRTVPVNVLTLDQQRYLVAARGETDWVRNLRAAGTAELQLGSRRETITAIELGLPPSAADAPLHRMVLRAYLRRWAFEVGAFFDGVTATSSDAELDRILSNHPIFTITSAEPTRDTDQP